MLEFSDDSDNTVGICCDRVRHVGDCSFGIWYSAGILFSARQNNPFDISDLKAFWNISTLLIHGIWHVSRVPCHTCHLLHLMLFSFVVRKHQRLVDSGIWCTRWHVFCPGICHSILLITPSALYACYAVPLNTDTAQSRLMRPDWIKFSFSDVADKN